MFINLNLHANGRDNVGQQLSILANNVGSCCVVKFHKISALYVRAFLINPVPNLGGTGKQGTTFAISVIDMP